MTAIVKALGREEVQGKTGSVSVMQACSGKYTGLYFSGIWCPPCRDFTCTLKKFYEQFQDRLEIIFVSWDYDEEDYNDYYDEMPWLAIPYSDRDTKERLCNAYEVLGTPRLVILKENGAVVSLNARRQIEDNPDLFPITWENTSHR